MFADWFQNQTGNPTEPTTASFVRRKRGHFCRVAFLRFMTIAQRDDARKCLFWLIYSV